MKSIKIIQLTILATILVMPAKYLHAEKGITEEGNQSSVHQTPDSKSPTQPIDVQYEAAQHETANHLATTSSNDSIKYSTTRGLAARLKAEHGIDSQSRYVEGVEPQGIVLTPEAKTTDAFTQATPFAKSAVTGDTAATAAVKNTWVSKFTSLFIDTKQQSAESILNSITPMVDDVKNASGVQANSDEIAKIAQDTTKTATSWVKIPTVTDLKNLVQSVSDAFTNLNPLRTANRYTKYADDGSYIITSTPMNASKSKSIAYNPDGSPNNSENQGGGVPTTWQAISNRFHNSIPFKNTNIYRSNVVSGQTGEATGARQRVITKKNGDVMSIKTTQPDGSYTITRPNEKVITKAAPKSWISMFTRSSKNADQATATNIPAGETAAAKITQDAWNTADSKSAQGTPPSWLS